MTTHALFGAAAAVAARLLLPGHSPENYLVLIALGAAGGLAADWFGQRAHLYTPNQPASWAMSALGAMAFLLVYGVVQH